MRRSTLIVVAALCIVALVPAPGSANVRLHGLFSEFMVLQQGTKVPVWGTAEAGEKVTVRLQGQEVSATAGKDGSWAVELANLKPGGPYEFMVIGRNVISFKNVLVGEVWLCTGQDNMEQALNITEDHDKVISISKNDKIRLYTVQHRARLYPQQDLNGSWNECGPATVGRFSAVGYYFGKDLQEALDVPIGLIQATWGNQSPYGYSCEAWCARHILSSYPELRPMLEKFDEDVDNYFNKQVPTYISSVEAFTVNLKKAQKERAEFLPGHPPAPTNPGHIWRNPTTVYNGMISPLIRFSIRGVACYQGESNVQRSHQYQTLFPALIKNWRADWNQSSSNYPFIFTQLAPFSKVDADPKDSHWAAFRESQFMTMRQDTAIKAPNTAMAVITDCGDQFDMTPRRKQPVGHRLALAARNMVYNQKAPGSGPIFEGFRVDGSKAIISFKNLGGGLQSIGGDLRGFAIAGEDQLFHSAEAVIQDDKVIVSNSRVAVPKAVRFGWANHPVVNLWSKEGLPASPFRTDEYPTHDSPASKKKKKP